MPDEVIQLMKLYPRNPSARRAAMAWNIYRSNGEISRKPVKFQGSNRDQMI
jgi:hypothetical protein